MSLERIYEIAQEDVRYRTPVSAVQFRSRLVAQVSQLSDSDTHELAEIIRDGERKP